jgi:hypothetical protein
MFKKQVLSVAETNALLVKRFEILPGNNMKRINENSFKKPFLEILLD